MMLRACWRAALWFCALGLAAGGLIGRTWGWEIAQDWQIIYFAVRLGTEAPSYYVMNRTGGAVRPLYIPDAPAVMPLCAPDGRALALLDYGGQAVYLVSAEGVMRQPLSFPRGLTLALSEARVVYGYLPEPTARIRVLGSAVVDLQPPDENPYPVYRFTVGSERLIAMTSPARSPALDAFTLDGRWWWRIGYGTQPQWIAPDHIASYLVAAWDGRLSMVDLDRRVRLTDMLTPDLLLRSYAWSPDRRHLIFSANTDQRAPTSPSFQEEIYVLDMITGARQRITDDPTTSKYVLCVLRFSPDGAAV